MSDKPKIDAEWMGEGESRMLFVEMPLSVYGDGPDPLKDLAAFQEWSDALRERQIAIADQKDGGPRADH